MDSFILFVVAFIISFMSDVAAEVCYEYKNSNTRAFECSDGCCGTRSNAYCCMSPAIIVGIAIGGLAFILCVGVIVFICYQKYKQRQFNKIQKISIGNTDGKHCTKNKGHEQQPIQRAGGAVTTHHGIGGQNNHSFFEDPGPRTSTWLFNTNNQQIQGGSYPPIQPWPRNEGTYKAQQPVPRPEDTPNLPGAGVMPVHPGAAELYGDHQNIRPLFGSLPPLPPVPSKKK